MPDSRGSVVCDAGPLIALARLDLLPALPAVLGTVVVPRTVRDECLRKSLRPDERVLSEVFSGNAGLVLVEDVLRLEVARHDLDPGESSALSVALERGCGVLMDDRRGRQVAETLRIPCVGTVGVLVLAKRGAYVTAVKPLLKRLVEGGYFLSERLCHAALHAAGED